MGASRLRELRPKSSPLKQSQPLQRGNEDLGASLARTKLFVVLEVERTGIMWKCCSPAVLFPGPAVSISAKGQRLFGAPCLQEQGAGAWSRRSARRPCPEGKASFPFPLAKLDLYSHSRKETVWLEKDADLPSPVKHSGNPGDEKNRPHGVKLKSLFYEVSWSFPVSVSLEEML